MAVDPGGSDLQVVEVAQVGPPGPPGTTSFTQLQDRPAAYPPQAHGQSHSLGSSDEITAAEAVERGAAAALDHARWVLTERRVTAPADGLVSDVLRLPGELAGPTQPVLSILPDGAVKLRLYVAENRIAGLAPGAFGDADLFKARRPDQ